MIIYMCRERERFPWLLVGRGGEGRISFSCPNHAFRPALLKSEALIRSHAKPVPAEAYHFQSVVGPGYFSIISCFLPYKPSQTAQLTASTI